MSVLGLDLESEQQAGFDLHEVLRGKWALLFSNPEDFETPDASAMQHRQCELAAEGVQAIAVKRESGPTASSWIDDISPQISNQISNQISKQAQGSLVRLPEPPFTASDPISFAARWLRGELLTLPSRFVMIIDGALKRRGVVRYSAPDTAVTMADLLARIAGLRELQLAKAA
jgi:alkyl hydroperoxide reductase subunit AhpC